MGSASLPYRWGGGIYNYHAALTLNNCTISSNTAVQGSGGGIYNDGNAGSATLTITNCTISGNSSWPGGGIFNYLGTVTITNSTLSGNSDNGSNAGGAIVNMGTLTITSSTFSGNSAGGSPNVIYDGTGGGIWNAQTLTMANCTLSGNSATNHGGGIYNGINGSQATLLKIGATILNAGPSGENIYNDNTFYPATVTSLGYNLSSDNGGGYLTATGDRSNTDPRLGPLQDNGGPTFTHLPAANSPAIDAGGPTLWTDQRGPGFVRIVNDRPDIGALEVQATPAPTPTPTPTPRPHGHGRN